VFPFLLVYYFSSLLQSIKEKMDKERVVYQLVAANYLSVQPRFCCKLIGVGYSITSIHPVCLELDFFATITLINFLI
jgi:hypothetical protein